MRSILFYICSRFAAYIPDTMIFVLEHDIEAPEASLATKRAVMLLPVWFLSRLNFRFSGLTPCQQGKGTYVASNQRAKLRSKSQARKSNE